MPSPYQSNPIFKPYQKACLFFDKELLFFRSFVKVCSTYIISIYIYKCRDDQFKEINENYHTHQNDLLLPNEFVWYHPRNEKET